MNEDRDVYKNISFLYYTVYCIAGGCPKATIGLCVEACSGDGDCSGDQICCFNGCGHTCTSPGKNIAEILKRIHGFLANLELAAQICSVSFEKNLKIKID